MRGNGRVAKVRVDEDDEKDEVDNPLCQGELPFAGSDRLNVATHPEPNDQSQDNRHPDGKDHLDRRHHL